MIQLVVISIAIKNRYKSDSPLFFIQLKRLAMSVGGSALAVISINSIASLALPSGLISSLSYVVAACVAIAGTSKLTKE
ncbi:hypothetical protein [uncultured Bacteroides sp.]|uniref:hypothetical protein n=1 Tax=uncultured Bacteroides sp. TaxID=162156 RepID=UPI002AA6657C|nr:hypothetical protein [uncultured Bacteroides sp.]